MKKFYFLLMSSILFCNTNRGHGVLKEIDGSPLSHGYKIAEKLDAYMQSLTNLNRFSGSVIVAKGDTIFLNKGYGLASHEFGIPNTPTTRFKICSITKMVTAVVVLQFAEKGLLKVSDPISKYLPDYPQGDKITIHHLLNHTSGIFSGNVPFEMVVCPATIEKIISFVKDKPLEFNPGSDYRYSNAGYFLLSAIIEKISGKKYECYVKENILEPVGMKESFFREYDYAILKNCATGYCMNEANTLVNGHFVYENFNGAGGLMCTAHDLYLFARALHSGKLINKKSLQIMFTPYTNQENFGYGCQASNFMNHKLIQHGGMLSSGFKTNLSIFIDDDIYIVILSNFFFSWVNEARDALAAILFGLPYDVPSCNTIKLDSSVYDDYAGIYDHPAFKSGYKIEKKNEKLYLPENIELSSVAPDQFMALGCNADNLVYTFVRNEVGHVTQLIITGGGPYFQVRCEKLGDAGSIWSKKAIQDLSFIKNTLTENHPGFYNATDPDFKKNLNVEYDKALRKSYGITTYQNYVSVVSDYAKSFYDVHLYVRMSHAENNTINVKQSIAQSFSAQEINPHGMWITIHTFAPDENQQKQLEMLIEQAPHWREKDVIVFDVRGNTGGNSVWAEKIVKSLFSDAYATPKINEKNSNVFADWRCSQENIKYIKTLASKFKDQFGEQNEAHQWVSNVHQNMLNAQQKGDIYFSEKSDISDSNVEDVKNLVKAFIVVIIDGSCVSACLDFIDYLKTMDYPVLLIGKKTKGDSIYMEIREVELPSGNGKFHFPIKVYRNRIRGNNVPYYPDVPYEGDMNNVIALKAWITDTIFGQYLKK